MGNSFGEILFENLQRIYELINVFAAQQLLSFWLPIISFVIDSKSWRLQKLLKLTTSFNFWT